MTSTSGIPHVSTLAGVSDVPQIPTVKNVEDVEKFVMGDAIPTACQMLEDLHEPDDTCIMPMFCAVTPERHPWIAWRGYVAAWRCFIADEPLPRDFLIRHASFAGAHYYFDDRSPLMDGARLSDNDAPLRPVSECIDWRGDWLNESPEDNALVEYWRGRHLIRKERATGRHQRVIDALRAKTGALEPHAVNYAASTLLDPLRAALEAAQT